MPIKPDERLLAEKQAELEASKAQWVELYQEVEVLKKLKPEIVKQ